MKFRTDFVTNSSSSSFTFTLTIDCYDGRTFKFHQYDGYEGQEEEPWGFFDHWPSVEIDFAQVANATDVDEFFEILIDGVTDGGYGDRRIFSAEDWKSSIEGTYNERDLTRADGFIDMLRENITSMWEISRFDISAHYGERADWDESYTYYASTGKCDRYSGGDIHYKTASDGVDGYLYCGDWKGYDVQLGEARQGVYWKSYDYRKGYSDSVRFSVQLDAEDMNGKIMRFENSSVVNYDALGEQVIWYLGMWLSPKKLLQAKAEDVQAMLYGAGLVNYEGRFHVNGDCSENFWETGTLRYIMGGDSADILCESDKFTQFVNTIAGRENMGGMTGIKSFTIRAMEGNGGADCFQQTYCYDRTTEEYTHSEQGIRNPEGVCGGLYVADASECTTK